MALQIIKKSKPAAVEKLEHRANGLERRLEEMRKDLLKCQRELIEAQTLVKQQKQTIEEQHKIIASIPRVSKVFEENKDYTIITLPSKVRT